MEDKLVKNKTCVFIAGKAFVGKTSMVRALTGCGREGYWWVKDLSGNRIWALVLLSAIGERLKFDPSDFPDALEKQIEKKRRFGGT